MRQFYIPFKEPKQLKSLFNLCTDFIAFNAECIESLEDFPLEIALKIWKSCIRQDKLAKSCLEKSSVHILETFNLAYPHEMLKECKLSDIFVINNYEEEIKVALRNCIKIDMSNSCLDESHDILAALSRNCPRLEQLNLSRNNLTSKSLRLLFGTPGLAAPCLPFPKLEMIDLAFNDSINLKALARYAFDHESLKKIATSVQNLPVEVKEISLKKWQLSTQEFEISAENVGFAGPLIDTWHERMKNDLKSKQAKLKTMKKDTTPTNYIPIAVLFFLFCIYILACPRFEKFC